MKPLVYLRADGSSEIGYGHLFRMLALSEILNADFAVNLLTIKPERHILELFSASGTTVIPVQKSETFGMEFEGWSATIVPGSIVVCDGYQFTGPAQKVLYDKGFKLVVIDDPQEGDFFARMIINPAGGINPVNYKAQPDTVIYTGIKYAFLRKEFLEAAKARTQREGKNSGALENVFVCLGGADPENYTATVLLKLADYDIKAINVVTGATFRHFENIERLVQKKQGRIIHHQNLSAASLIKLMMSSHAAVCSASTIAYEYLCCAENFFIICTAENQRNAFNYMIADTLANDFSNFDSPVSINSKKIHELFDGLQSTRIAAAFQALSCS